MMKQIARWLVGLAMVGGCCSPMAVLGNGLVVNREYMGRCVLFEQLPGRLLPRATFGLVYARASSTEAEFHVLLAGVPLASATYRMPASDFGEGFLTLTWTDGLPQMPATAMGIASSEVGMGTSLICVGGWPDVVGVGRARVLLAMELNQRIEPPPSSLPGFDGVTLRAPSEWAVQRFEVYAAGGLSKLGELPGGDSAEIPAAWRDGQVLCRTTLGHSYSLPLSLTYEGFPAGVSLYPPADDVALPGWEPMDRWDRADVWVFDSLSVRYVFH